MDFIQFFIGGNIDTGVHTSNVWLPPWKYSPTDLFYGYGLGKLL